MVGLKQQYSGMNTHEIGENDTVKINNSEKSTIIMS